MKLSADDLAAARREAERAPTKLSAEQLRLLRANGCPVGRRDESAAS